MTGDIKRNEIIRDAAALLAFAVLVWLTDLTAAYAAGARWFTWRFLLPSIGLLFVASWIALGLSLPFRRRLPVALTILAFGGAFLLWTYRLAGWPANVTPWLIQTMVIAAAPFLILLMTPRAAVIASPLFVLAYHIAKSVHREGAAAMLHREMPALAVAIGIAIAALLLARAPVVNSRRLQEGIVAGGAVVAIGGVVTLFAWSGRSFPIVTSSAVGHGRASAGAPNIVLVLVDTLRVDRLGVYGYRVRPTSPFIDAIAARGDVYRNAYASSSWTVPSVATIFTGLMPQQHGVVVYGCSLPASVATLAERLRRHGYATSAIVSNYLVDVDHGFGRGFDRFALLVRFNSQTGEPAPIWIDALLVGHFWLPDLVPGGTPKPSAPTVVDEALRAVDVAPRNRPLFLYIHFLDPHHPCDAPVSATTRDWKPGADDRSFDAQWSVQYDREVRYVDDELRRFFDTAQSKLGPNVTMILVADHGEELGERGRRGHGSNLDEALLRVPLVVARPDARGSNVNEAFSLTHLADLVESNAIAQPNEAVRAHLVPPPSPDTTMTAVEHDGWKLVTTDVRSSRSEELFRLPDETRNELRQQPQIASALRTLRDAMPNKTASEVVDPEARAKMRALGYIH